MADQDLDAILDDALDDFDTNLEDDDVAADNTENILTSPITAANNDNNNNTTFGGATRSAVNTSETASNSNNNNSNSSSSTTSSNNNSNDSMAGNTSAQDAIEQALNAMENSCEEANLGASGAETDMGDFLKNILDSFNFEEGKEGGGDSSDNMFDNALKSVMGSLFDPSSLREPISMIVERYPKWLDDNKDKLSQSQFENYEKQYSLYLEAWNLLKNEDENENDNDTSQDAKESSETKGGPADDAKQTTGNENKVMELLFETFSYGSLPSEVMEGMMPDELKPFADKMTELEKEIDNEDADGSNKESNGNEEEEDFNLAEAMKMFEQLMGSAPDASNASNASNASSGETSENDNNVNDGMAGFKPDFSQIPKLSPEEMQEFQKLVSQNGECLIM